MSKAAATHPLLGCCAHRSTQDPAKVSFSPMHAMYGAAACPMLHHVSDLETSAFWLCMQDRTKVHWFWPDATSLLLSTVECWLEG